MYVYLSNCFSRKEITEEQCDLYLNYLLRDTKVIKNMYLKMYHTSVLNIIFIYFFTTETCKTILV